MSNRRAFSITCFQYRELTHILSLLAVALVLAIVLAPTLTSFASVHFASPASPVSPIIRPKLPPTFLPPGAAAATTSQAGTQTPERVRPTSPAVETPEQVQAPPPPPPTPAVAQPVAGPPPTLWIVVGLLVIGAIVAALIFFRKS
jgi:hypothetical protein